MRQAADMCFFRHRQPVTDVSCCRVKYFVIAYILSLKTYRGVTCVRKVFTGAAMEPFMMCYKSSTIHRNKSNYI